MDVVVRGFIPLAPSGTPYPRDHVFYRIMLVAVRTAHTE